MSNKKAVKEDKDVLFAYVSPENRAYIEELVLKHNEKISSVIDKLIESHRTGKKIAFTTVIPDYVKKAEAWKKKHC